MEKSKSINHKEHEEGTKNTKERFFYFLFVYFV